MSWDFPTVAGVKKLVINSNTCLERQKIGMQNFMKHKYEYFSAHIRHVLKAKANKSFTKTQISTTKIFTPPNNCWLNNTKFQCFELRRPVNILVIDNKYLRLCGTGVRFSLQGNIFAKRGKEAKNEKHTFSKKTQKVTLYSKGHQSVKFGSTYS